MCGMRRMLVGCLVGWLSVALATEGSENIGRTADRGLACERFCRDLAERVFHDCLADGGDEDICRHRAAEAAERCFQEKCNPSEECEQRCHARAKRALHACREEGGDDETCLAHAREMLHHCLHGECGQPPDCERICDERAERVFRECMDSGVGQDACAARTREFLQRCITEECDRPVECEQACFDRSRRAFNACREDGTGIAECAPLACEVMGRCLHECTSRCGGIAGIPCEEHQYCRFPEGTCGRGDIFGACAAVPPECPEHWEPVCGCDGETYANGCLAAAAGASIRHPGECER